MANWRSQITLIRNGTSVDAPVTNVPLAQLAERTQYLYDRLNSASIGEGLVLSAVAISTDVELGDAVYYSFEDELYKPALATAVDSESGQLRTADSAYVRGVVVRKQTVNTADVLVAGLFRDFVPTDEDDVALTNGNYYLSAVTAGKLTSSRPAVAIYVGSVSDGDFFAQPVSREVLEDHIHYRFALETNPCGTPYCAADNTTQLTSTDATIAGWLNANNEVFQSNAPTGAKFGYNWTVDPNLAAVWPPQPASSAYLELDGVGVAPELVQIDRNGIWWMSECQDQLPWAPSCYSSSVANPESAGSSSSLNYDSQVCLTAERRMTLWFTRLVSKTDQAVVTGVKAADGSPIVVSGCTNPDVSGFCTSRVTLDLNMDWQQTAGTTGSLVVKGITGNTALQVGHVVEGARGIGLISISGTEDLEDGYSAGLLTVDGLDPSAITRKLGVEVVALNGATESLYQNVLSYVGLPKSRVTSFIGKVQLPDMSFTVPTLDLVLWLAVPTTGTPPANVTLEYLLIDSASMARESSSSLNGGGFNTLPTTWSDAIDLNLEDVGEADAGSYFSIMPLTIEVQSDQILLFRMSRSASDAYAGELAVINMFAVVRDGD